MANQFAANRITPARMHYGLTDLKIFLAVAEEGNLTRGALRSNLAASSVSLRIKGLEDAVGSQLLIRQARGVTLTPAGQIMLEHTRRCLAQLEQMNVELLPYRQQLTSHITLFANNIAINSFLPDDLARFFALYPNVRATLEDRVSLAIPAEVAAGRADVGVCAYFEEYTGLEFLPYRHDQLVLLTPLSSKIGAAAGVGEAVDFISCINEPFVSPQFGSSFHTALMSNAAALGMQLDVRVQVSSYDAIARMVASGAGVGVVPRSALNARDYDQVRVVELSDSWTKLDIRVCVRKQSLVCNVFRKKLVEVLCAEPR